MKKIAIIFCDASPRTLPPFVPSFDSLFKALFGSVRKDVGFEYFDAPAGRLPEKIDPDTLYLIPGSASGAWEKDPWILALLGWIRSAYASGAKLAGICFGFQALAVALGGDDSPSPKGWGFGLRRARVLSPELREILGGRDTITLSYNHHDQVTALPPGAERMSASDFCENESFRIGSQVVAFQGHPEYSPEYLRWHIERSAGTEGEAFREKCIESLNLGPADGSAAAEMMMRLLEGKL